MSNNSVSSSLALAMISLNEIDTCGINDKLFFVAHVGGSNGYEQHDSYENFCKQNKQTLGDKLVNFSTALKLLTSFVDFYTPDYNANYVDY